MSTVTISAVYNSPLPAPSDCNTSTISTTVAVATEASSQTEQTAHVTAVRESVSQLQDLVNAYLTERMGEEKRLDLGKAMVGEEEGLEEKYGEEEAEEVWH
jgi:hypothetical protein